MDNCETTAHLDHIDLWSDVPPREEALGQADIFVRSSGQADLWSDVPPTRDILWPSVTTLVRLTFDKTYPQQRHLVAMCDTTAH